jgi:hypothetical protein
MSSFNIPHKNQKELKLEILSWTPGRWTLHEQEEPATHSGETNACQDATGSVGGNEAGRE